MNRFAEGRTRNYLVGLFSTSGVFLTFAYFVFRSTDSCDVPAMFRNIILFCHDSYSHEDEDTNVWESQTGTFNTSLWSCPENWKYSKDEQLGGFDSWGRFAVYHGGGYIANLGYNKLIARRVINDLITNNWIDSQTRAVIIEFSLFNPSSNILAVMSYFFEVLPSGFTGTFKTYGILALNATDSQARDTYLFFVLLFGLFLVLYFIIECIKMVQQKCSYFKSSWNWLELFQILTASLALLLQWVKSKEVKKTLAKLKENPFIPVSFQQALYWSETETVAICITSAIATIRLLKCFHFNSQVIKLSSFMRNHFTSMASFFFIFCVLSSGYAVSGMIAFGSENWMFSSFAKAFTSQYLMVIGSNSLIHELEEGGFIMSRIFLVSFFFTTIIIITNMFVAILNDSYSNSCLDQENEQLDIADFIVSRFLQSVFGYNPEDNGDTTSLSETTDQVRVDELQKSENETNAFENNAWRSNWSFAVRKITPSMYRSRKVSFENAETFGDNAETYRSKKTLNHTDFKNDFHSDISEETISVESEEATWDLGDGYDVMLQYKNGIDYRLTNRYASLVDNDEKDYAGHNDDDDDDNNSEDGNDDDYVNNVDYVHDVVIGDADATDATDAADAADTADGNYDDDVACSGRNRDVWKEIFHLLDDNGWDDFPHHSTGGVKCYDNPAVVEDSELVFMECDPVEEQKTRL